MTVNRSISLWLKILMRFLRIYSFPKEDISRIYVVSPGCITQIFIIIPWKVP
jgi:hypothetical protein